MSSSSIHLPTPKGLGAGHWVAEQASEELLVELNAFLAPYREDGGNPR